MALDDPVPDRLLVSHPEFRGDRAALAQFDLEMIGDATPEMTPAEKVAVGCVEGLVAGGVGGGHPLEGAGEVGRVRHVGDGVEAVGVARIIEGEAQFLGDRGPGADGGHEVADTLGREVVDDVGARGGPGPVSALLAPGKQVLLVIVEVRRHVAAGILAGGRGAGTEVDAVPLGARDEMDVGQVRGGRLQSVDQVSEHRDVGLHVFDAAFLEWCARSVEGVRYLAMGGERGPGAGGIHEIGANVGQALMRR